MNGPGSASHSRSPIQPARLPSGLRLVYPYVTFNWNRHVHVASRSPAIQITLCGRVRVGEPAPLESLRRHGITLEYSYVDTSQPELSLCPRCAARI